MPQGSGAIVYSNASIENADFCSLSQWIYSAVCEHNKKAPHPGNDQEGGKSGQNNIDDDYCHRMYQRFELIIHTTVTPNNSGFPEYTELHFSNPSSNITVPPPEFS